MGIVELITQYGIVGGSFIFLLLFFIKQYRQITKDNKELLNIYITTLTEIKDELKADRNEKEEMREDIKKIKNTLGV